VSGGGRRESGSRDRLLNCSGPSIEALRGGKMWMGWFGKVGARGCDCSFAWTMRGPRSRATALTIMMIRWQYNDRPAARSILCSTRLESLPVEWVCDESLR
jgi:hypothetical protein